MCFCPKNLDGRYCYNEFENEIVYPTTTETNAFRRYLPCLAFQRQKIKGTPDFPGQEFDDDSPENRHEKSVFLKIS